MSRPTSGSPSLCPAFRRRVPHLAQAGCGWANCPVTRCPRRYALRRRATRASASRRGRSRWRRLAREGHAPGPGWPGPSLSRRARRLQPRPQRSIGLQGCSDSSPCCGLSRPSSSMHTYTARGQRQITDRPAEPQPNFPFQRKMRTLSFEIGLPDWKAGDTPG